MLIHTGTRLLSLVRLSPLILALASVSVATNAKDLPLTDATILELGAAMDAGTLSSQQLVQMYLDRIEAYDQQGPSLNTVILLNPHALDRARELDQERASTGPRSPLHGIPVVIKDNLDTADMPTTAGSFMLAGSLPPDDAYVVKKLRDAGAVILAKLNLSEFASGGSLNSLGGVIANPHHLGRTPSGSSGGTGAAIAAGFASMGLGTDTGGSVRGPSSANGIVGLKTTHGLVSRDGVVPLALSFDTVGPMTRNVTDLAIALGVLTGVDSADDSTQKSTGKSHVDYSPFLNADSLAGARIGVARVFMGDDDEVDWLVESALQSMRDAGAEIIDVEFPDWLLESRGKFYRAIRYPEFKSQIADYLATLGDGYPKTLDELITQAMPLNAQRQDGVIPNPSRWALMRKEVEASGLDGFEYQAVKTHAMPLVAQTIAGMMSSNTLDAIVYPTSSTPAELTEQPAGTSEPGSGGSPVILANLSGFPDLILPIGFTGRGMPVTLSFLGDAFSEPKLIALGYALEQRLQAIRLPVHTPPLPGHTIP
ncbi:MAG: amidase family protein [Congregibacter sp.]|nr:amidase family protein [Congregibacter sp.]